MTNTLTTWRPVHISNVTAFDLYFGRFSCARTAQSVQRLAMGWKVWESNAGGGKIFRVRPHRSWSPASILYNGYRVIVGGNSAGAWLWPAIPI